MEYQHEIDQCISTMRSGGLILYPTDTIWGIGCDATNPKSIEKVYQLKKRPDHKALILLCEDEAMVRKYIPNAPDSVFSFLRSAINPTTVIYNDPEGLPKNLLGHGHSIAIRIPNDPFCLALLQYFKKPVISTSANISGMKFSGIYIDINEEIKNGVDYIVQHRRNDINKTEPSSIIRLTEKGEVEKIR